MWLVMWCYFETCSIDDARASNWRPPIDWSTLSSPWIALETRRPLTLDGIQRVADGARFATQAECITALRGAVPTGDIRFRREPRGEEPGYQHIRHVAHRADFVDAEEAFTTIPGMGPAEHVLLACFEEEPAPVG